MVENHVRGKAPRNGYTSYNFYQPFKIIIRDKIDGDLLTKIKNIFVINKEIIQSLYENLWNRAGFIGLDKFWVHFRVIFFISKWQKPIHHLKLK